MLDFMTNTPNIRTLESALKVSSLRHKVISNNIANVDTPFFKRSEVIFEDYLKEYLDAKDSEKTSGKNAKMDMVLTNSRHISNKTPDVPLFLGATVNTVNDLTMRTDGNNVDIDVEMANLTKNSIYYQTVAQRINGYFSNLRTVIEGR